MVDLGEPVEPKWKDVGVIYLLSLGLAEALSILSCLVGPFIHQLSMQRAHHGDDILPVGLIGILPFLWDVLHHGGVALHNGPKLLHAAFGKHGEVYLADLRLGEKELVAPRHQLKEGQGRAFQLWQEQHLKGTRRS